MGKEHQIHPSNKTGIKTKESYIVTRKTTSFLRIIGEKPHYKMWTATASEDSGEFHVCRDQVRLASAALKFGAELGTQPSRSKDRSGREFIYVCEINIKPGGTSKDDEDVLDRVIGRFFEIYDACDPSQPEQRNEMREIYQCFATDDSGDDVYLSDGVWLRNNGSTHDSGR